MTKRPLRLLLAEDSDDDALLLLNALKGQGFSPETTRVMTAKDFREALEGDTFEIILCDYTMPGFNAIEALDILRGSRMDTPLVIVSGTIGEAVAVEAMRHGAADYLLKDSLIRLGGAVEREIREADTRRLRRLLDSFSRSQTEILEMILKGVPLTRILDHIIRRVEILSVDETFSSIMRVNPEGSHLVVAACGHGMLEKSLKELGPIPIGAGIGSCGSAAALGRTVIVEDLATHPDWSMFREITTKYGLHSCWSVPVFASDRTILGTLAVYHGVSHSPSPEELRWVEAVSKLASLAIERCQAAEKLRESETLLQIASNAARIGGWIVDFPEACVKWSDQVCAIHEVPAGTSPSFAESLEFIVPEMRDRIAGAFEKCRSEGRPFDEEMQIVTARGRRAWVRAIGEGIRDEKGSVTRIQGGYQEITDKKQAEEAIRANELRYLRQRNALINLTKNVPPEGHDILEAFQKITETAARTLNVERVGIWQFAEDRSAIECLDLFELTSGAHSSGMTLVAAKYPAYFEGLATMELIPADDARNDYFTREFVDNYLIPLGISSMMDVPIHSAKQVRHIICCEHVGPMRHWTGDEKTFAVAIGNLVSLSLESCDLAAAREEILLSHQRFQSVAAATNDTIWDWNLETGSFWWNDGFARLFGWSAPEIGNTIRVWIRQIHPDDRQRVVTGIFAVIDQGGTLWSDTYRFVSNDGSISHVLDRGEVIRDAAGKGIRMVGGMMDLTASKEAEFKLARSHRALRMLSSCNEMLIRTSEEGELLAEACRIAVEIGGYRMAWVGYAKNDESRSVVPVAHAGEEAGYLSQIRISWADDSSPNCEPSGQAIRSGETVVVEHIPRGADVSSWSYPAVERGYLNTICLPLRDEKRVFGVLALYGAESYSAEEDEIKMLRELANNLSFGIGNIRDKEQRRRVEEVVVKVAQTVSSGIGSEFFDLLAKNMVEALGALGGIIGHYDPGTHTIRSLSYYLDGKAMDEVVYELAGTPCDRLIDGDLCLFEQGVQQMFPEDHLLEVLGIESYAGIPLTSQDGRVTGIMAVFFSGPLTETALVESILRIFAARVSVELDRQQADARIREQASLLDSARDAIIVRDLDHKVIYWNKSAERLYGWTADEAIGSCVTNLLYNDDSIFIKAHRQTLYQGEWIGEMQQIDRNGRVLTIEAHWTLVCDDDGLPRSIFAINTDISERRMLEQQFLRAQRLESIGTLAGGIAHDLNNILAPICMAVELLRMRDSDDQSTTLLEAISSSAKRGANLVGQVLSFARGSVEVSRDVIDSRRIITEIEDILRDTFPRNVEVTLNADHDLWAIHGDPTQLHQVVLNLCVNARDAINGEGSIRVSAANEHIDESFAAINLGAKAGPHVRIEVEDTGEGIAPEIMDRIYDPFFTTKSADKGTGLGLATTLAIVKSHGGFIRALSTPGEGTCFRIYLPAFTEPLESADVHVPGKIQPGGGRTVLVVDDEESIRETVRQILESYGYRTLLAANGEQGASIYTKHQSEIDVVLTDMTMPVMDGPAMISRLTEINPLVKIIVTSGLPAGEDHSPTTAHGIKCFLPKPFSSEALLNLLEQVLADEAANLQA